MGIGAALFAVAVTLGVASPHEANAAQTPRILYASNWTGQMQIFAVDPARGATLGQITFGIDQRCPAALQLPGGYERPIPSRDGRYVLFRCTSREMPSLWVARADGRAARLVRETAHARMRAAAHR